MGEGVTPITYWVALGIRLCPVGICRVSGMREGVTWRPLGTSLGCEGAGDKKEGIGPQVFLGVG